MTEFFQPGILTVPVLSVVGCTPHVYQLHYRRQHECSARLELTCLVCAGDRAREIFGSSGLPSTDLGHIW